MADLETVRILARELESAIQNRDQFFASVTNFTTYANIGDSKAMDKQRELLHVLLDKTLDGIAIVGMLRPK